MRQDFLRIRRYLLPAGAAVAGALLLVELRVERASVERANRLHRAGKAEAAVGIYDAALSASRGADLESELRYNLGTSLLRAGQLQEAEVELRRGLGTLDPETAQRGQVNLGYRYLSDALGTLAPDSAVQLLIAAVDSYRGALRLDPASKLSRLNLEIAQARMDSILSSLPKEESAFLSPLKSEQEIEKGVVSEGEDEAAASGDGAPMTQAGANLILEASKEDPAKMIRRLLFGEGPGRWENQGKRW